MVKLLSILATRQSNILTGASILMIAVFASKFLGLIRDRLLVHVFDSNQAAIFLAAFGLPDILFQILIFGALSVAFIPVYTDYLNHKGEKEAFEFGSNILNLSLLIFGLVAIIAFIFTPLLNNILVPGFVGNQKSLTDQLTRLIILAQLILIVGSFFIAISHSYQRFIVPALAPLFYNLGIILGIAVLTPFFGIYGPAYGVIIGAFLHVVIQIPLIRSLGFKYQFSFNIFDKGIRQIFNLMSVRSLGLAAELLSERVAMALATLITPSSLTILTFAQHLHVVPIGLFGTTIAQAALPVLSREQAKNEDGSFKITLLTTMHQILFLTLPAAAILVVLRIPIVRLVFGASQFSWNDTVLTGRTVAFLALGLAAQSVMLLLVRGFYALKDTKTPVIVSIVTVVINIVLSVIFTRIFNWDVWGLGLAYAVSSNLSLFLLVHFLGQKLGGFEDEKLMFPALKMVLAATISAAALYIPMKLLDQLVFDTTRTLNLIFLTGIASILGLGIYLFLVWYMKVEEIYTFGRLVRNLANFKSKFKAEEIVTE